MVLNIFSFSQIRLTEHSQTTNVYKCVNVYVVDNIDEYKTCVKKLTNPTNPS